MQVSGRSLLHTIDDIYAASTEPHAWQRVVDRIHSFFPEAGINLQGYQKNGSTPQFFFVHQGYDPGYVRRFQQDYAPTNPWTAYVPRMPLGVPHIISESEFLPHVKRTDFHSHACRNGSGFGLGMPIWVTPERLFFFVIECSEREAETLNKPAAQFARLLGPHLARSFAISHRLGALETGSGLASMIERTPAPIIIVDNRRRIKLANHAGEVLLATSDMLQRQTNGKIVLRDTMSDGALGEAIRCCTACEINGATPLLIPMVSGTTAQSIVVAPVIPDKSLASGAPGAPAAVEHLALLLFLPRTASASDPQRLFQQTFDLTRAEAALAVALSAGESLAQYAARRGVAMATVRNQLQAVFDKTMTHRQGALIALLSRVKRGLPG